MEKYGGILCECVCVCAQFDTNMFWGTRKELMEAEVYLKMQRLSGNK